MSAKSKGILDFKVEIGGCENNFPLTLGRTNAFASTILDEFLGEDNLREHISLGVAWLDSFFELSEMPGAFLSFLLTTDTLEEGSIMARAGYSVLPKKKATKSVLDF